MKIVLIGAGSMSFGRGLIADVLASQELEKLDGTLVLVDTSEENLNLMLRFALALKEFHQRRINIEATTERKTGLAGANYVITSVAAQRYHFWRQDFFLPLSFGFKHIYGENGGPGAAFHTLRSLNLMVPIVKDMEEICPQAWLLNFTNPESRICLAIKELTRIRAVGLCHGPAMTLTFLARTLNLPEEMIDLTVGGINHFHWVMSLRHRKDGTDLYPLLRKKIEGDPKSLPPLTYLLFSSFGLLPFPADSHIGEYIPYAYQVCGPFSGLRMLERPLTDEKNSAVTARSNLEKAAAGDREMLRQLAVTTRENAVSIIAGLKLNLKRRELSVNLPNENLAVSNLPAEAIVEVPAVVDGDGLHPEKVGPLPEPIAAYCRLQHTIQKLLVRAYAERSKELLYQALLLEPTVDDADRCRQMMEEFFRLQAGYLPEMS